MVKEQDIDKLKELLEIFRRVVRRLNNLNQRNWKVKIEIPFTGETTTYDIPDTKKQQMIQDAINKRNALKAEVESIDWNSLN